MPPKSVAIVPEPRPAESIVNSKAEAEPERVARVNRRIVAKRPWRKTPWIAMEAGRVFKRLESE
jgi:hypothetical protein